MKPLVSILVPAFNAAEWIEESLRSAIAQTWPRTEIIVVDDGSTDQTLAIARRCAARNVNVVSKPNEGAAATRNYALSLSQGDYIQWLDADDLLSPRKIEQQMRVFERADDERIVTSCAWGRFIHRPSRARFVPTPIWHDLEPFEWLLRKLEGNLYMQTATWLVPRDITEAAGPWNTDLLGDDDGEYFTRVLLQSHGVRFVPEAKVFYRMPWNSNLSYIGRGDAKLEAQFRSMRLHVGYMLARHDNARVRAACLAYLQTWLFNFHPHRPDIVNEAGRLAESLGGRLRTPELSWKYAWIERLGGRPLAAQASLALPRWKWSVVRRWDKVAWQAQRFSGSGTQL